MSEWAWGPFAAAWERLEPFWNELCGERPRTRRLAGEPENKSDGRLYGFDVAGRVVVSREYDYRGELKYETLRVRGLDDDVVLGYSTDPWIGSRRLWQLHAPRFADDGTLSRLDIWSEEEKPGIAGGARRMSTRPGGSSRLAVHVASDGPPATNPPRASAIPLRRGRRPADDHRH